MSDFAIVIGINKYPKPLRPLQNSVPDALNMARWLLDKAKVPAENLFLLLDDPKAAQGMPEDAEVRGADGNAILQAIKDADDRSAETSERLFFYYAGHGLSTRILFADMDAIIPADFDEENSLPIGVADITRRLQAAKFRYQFFIIDACRNLFEGEMPLRPLRPTKPDPTRPVQQYVFLATPPGLQAIDERGTLTQVLLDGLAGKGRAKVWMQVDGMYEVSADRLIKYAAADFERRKVDVNAGPDVFQVPRLAGEHTEPDVVLARLEAGKEVGRVKFDVLVDPPDATRVDRLIVVGDDTFEQRQQIPGFPVEFQLFPRIYSLRLEARPGFRPLRRGWTIELYDDAQVETLGIEAMTDGDAEVSFGLGPEPVGAPATRGLDLESSAAERPATGPAHLVLRGDDPLAVLELADRSGRTVAGPDGAPRVGFGTLDCRDLEPGIYRARLRTPEDLVEVPVEAFPGENDPVVLRAPAPPPARIVRELTGAVGFRDAGPNQLEVSELATLTGPRLSTILALAGDATNRPGAWFANGNRLRGIGLKPFRDATGGGSCGLQVLFGIELDDPVKARQSLDTLGLRLWRFGRPVPESPARVEPIPAMGGLAQFAAATGPGPHWLAFEIPGHPPVVFALAIWEGRLSNIVIHEDGGGRIDVFQYLPALDDRGPAGADALRRLDLAQRFLPTGRFDQALALIDGLLGESVTPVAGSLGGYLLMKLDRLDRLDDLSRRLVDRFPELSDSHVIRAAALAGRGDDEAARAEYARALDAGLPIFRPCLEQVAEGVKRYGIDHPRAPLLDEVLARRVMGLLWAAWTPADFTPGQPLDLDV